jgi:molybdopterin-containing oxidoreductase family molybdopterin binding subunit
MSDESFVYTACPGWGDHDYCALKTIVKNGKIVRTERAVYPDQELAEDAHICQKGCESCTQPYNPDRLLYPLKRKGKRGSGKWERITWDKALDEIADKMLAIKDKYGAESVAFWNFPAGIPGSMNLQALLSNRLMGLWGATDSIQGYGLDNGPFYAGFYTFDNPFNVMSIDPRCFISSKLLIVWGANPVENQERVAMNLVRAREAGAKIIDIGLVFDGTAGMADEFIPVKPGSDIYLELAMANYIVQYDMYDHDFMLQHTIASYLVDITTGDVCKDSKGNYLIWDKKTAKAKKVAPHAGSFGKAQPAFEGTYIVDGKTCKPVFQLLKEHLASYTLEEAENICGVPIETIIDLTEEYIAADGAFIIGSLGLRYLNQGESYRGMYLLGALSGNIGKDGGGVTTSLGCSTAPIMYNNAAITQPNGPEGDKMKFVRQKDFFQQVQTGKPYPIKAMLVCTGNPVHNCPNRGRWLEAFQKMDLVVDIDIWMNDTGEISDYVLPDCMPFECENILEASPYGHVVLQEPAIKPRGEAKDANFLWSGLAKRLGFGEYFDKTNDEWLDIKLSSEQLSAIRPKINMKRMHKEKLVAVDWDKTKYFDPLRGVHLDNDSGRMSIYAEGLKSVNMQFPTYVPPLESPVIDGNNKKYPYQFFTGRQRFFMQSMFTDDPVMTDLSGGKPSARMNPLDADKEGIKDGDKVDVYNQRGHVTCPMYIDAAIPPGTIQVWFGWRRRQYEDGTYAELLVPIGAPETVNEVADLWWDQAAAKYGIAHQVNGGYSSTYSGTFDTIWDCACAVRKLASGKEA